MSKKKLNQNINLLHDKIMNITENISPNPELLMNYIKLQDSIPFELYFNNQFKYLIKRNSVKKFLSFKKEKKEKENEFIDIMIKNGEMKNKGSLFKYKSKNNQQNQINQINPSEKVKFNSNSSSNKSFINSNLSFSLSKIQDKIVKKEEDINEIILQKESFINEIINENNISKKGRINYFDDTNNLNGNSFEQFSIKFIFELIKCLSVYQDFLFFHNIEVKSEKLNDIFKKNNLKEINDCQIDFQIINLRIYDLLNLIIYLFPNCMKLDFLKKTPFQKEMDIQKLKQLKEQYKNSNKRIDVFGEIAVNLFNEDEKINQLKKYRRLFYNLNYLSKNKIDEQKLILENFNFEKNNPKLILFITNGEYENFYNKIREKNKFTFAQDKFNINSLVIYLNNNFNLKEKNIIDNLIIHYSKNSLSLKGKELFMEQLIQEKQKKIEQSNLNLKFKNIILKLNQIERKVKSIEKEFSTFIREKKMNSKYFNFLQSFNFYKYDLIQNFQSNLELFNSIKLNEENKINSKFSKINIVLLHNKELNVDTFLKIKGNNKDYNFFPLFYTHELEFTKEMFYKKNNECFSQLIKSLKNNFTILIFQYSNDKLVYNIWHLYKELYDKLKINYLNHLILIKNKNNEDIIESMLQLQSNHIHKLILNDDIETQIINKINSIKPKLEDNYKIFCLEKAKYFYILKLYKKFHKYTIFESNISKKKHDFLNVINEQQNLFFKKMNQDLLFYTTLSIKKNSEILIPSPLIQELIKIFDNNEIIDEFIKENSLINEIKIIINNIIYNIEEKSKTNNFDYNLTFDKSEIVSINGQQNIYENNEEEKEKEKEKESGNESGSESGSGSESESENENENVSDDNGDDLKEDYDFSSYKNVENNNKKLLTNIEYFKVDFVIDEIKTNLEYSLKLINYKIYYKLFTSIILKEYENCFLYNLSKQITEKS